MAVDIHQLTIVYSAYVMAAGSPGPSNMRIMGVAMQEGRRAGLAMACGVVTGSVFWGIMAATGVSTILTSYPQALSILRILGGLYLLFLSAKAALAAFSPEKTAPSEGEKADLSSGALYRRGLLMHLTNPKAVLAWIALLTLGLDPASGRSSVAAVLFGCAILSVTIFCGYAVVFSTRPMVAMYRRCRRWIEAALAASFGLAGFKLLISSF